MQFDVHLFLQTETAINQVIYFSQSHVIAKMLLQNMLFTCYCRKQMSIEVHVERVYHLGIVFSSFHFLYRKNKNTQITHRRRRVIAYWDFGQRSPRHNWGSNWEPSWIPQYIIAFCNVRVVTGWGAKLVPHEAKRCQSLWDVLNFRCKIVVDFHVCRLTFAVVT